MHLLLTNRDVFAWRYLLEALCCWDRFALAPGLPWASLHIPDDAEICSWQAFTASPLELLHNYMYLSCPQFFLGCVLLDPFYPGYPHLFCHLKCISSSLLFTAFRFCRMLSFLTHITAKPYKIHNLSCIYIKVFSPVLSFLLTHFSNSSTSVWHWYARTSNTVPPVLCTAGSSPPQKIMALPLCVAPKSYTSAQI